MNNDIILATERDREEVLKLYEMQKGREFCAWDEDYPSNETIDFDLSRDSLFIMKENDRIIAAISIEVDEAVDNLDCWDKKLFPGGELARIAVEPSMQGRGIARKMMKHGMDVLKERGYKSIHFLVNKYNEKAIRSYSFFNFNVVGECFMYDQDFLCYEKEL
ncbi:GNAT family N-acetyltransferase [Butyrivibrio sp. AC2005]|uniref:GNAT family N-acetyltransferase n=1 Tax=Butyrivibrio sp. AC2005 TaxID=1280672 RepID=UPI0003FC8D0E|nr:GNAT family N-acetyltransferase [Butyrivibrio sp. AC2005]